MEVVLADTNAILYFLKGLAFMEKYKNAKFAISEISEIELLGVKDIALKDLEARKKIIDSCILLPLKSDIKILAIQLKQKTTLKVPDAVIAATSIYYNLPLVTADKEFKKIPGLPLQLLEL